MRTACPDSLIFAFEANPENYLDFCLRPEIAAARINVQNMAIAEEVGAALIRVPEYASRRSGTGTIDQRGTSSLLPKAQVAYFVDYEVPKTTLDAFFAAFLADPEPPSFGFWIDVEGLAAQVLAGMSGTLRQTRVLKIEVEDVEYYQGQIFAGDIRQIMEDAGFRIHAQTDPSPGQYDLLFVRG